ncbi:MAG: phosphate ABC transporter substrate-binding protein [Anaerolineae bacterium]|nr:phosphate ABC transporter substrate-binding protein [Anaerolineae bacterium]
MRVKRASMICVLTHVCMMLLLTKCSWGEQVTISPPAIADRGHITFAGSTTVQPLADKLGQTFQELLPGVTLDIAAGGSSVGIQAIHDGVVDIGMASRSLKEDEKEGITVHQIAVDVIAMVVHETNPINNLSLAQLEAIYRGQITNWQEVGGVDDAIVVIIRAKSSGTRDAFDEIVLSGDDPTAPNQQTAITAGNVAAIVAENPHALGYVGFGNLEAGLKTISIDGVQPTKQNAQDGTYKLQRPLSLLTGPLTTPLGQQFVDYALSDNGQQVVIENGWIPVK